MRTLPGGSTPSEQEDRQDQQPAAAGDQDLQAAADAGGHIIAWADDWEVSGATDPMTRKGLGPWRRGEMGPYDGIVAPTVDRVGRNVRDTLNTQELLTSQDRVVVTADHAGVWDFSDPNQENEWLAKAWGSQMELRAIQKRNRDETIRARKAGEPKQRPSYGYMYVRLVPMGKVDHVALDEVGAEIIREVARRILADDTGKITVFTEAVRLTREGIPSPGDRRASCMAAPGRAGRGPGIPSSTFCAARRRSGTSCTAAGQSSAQTGGRCGSRSRCGTVRPMTRWWRRPRRNATAIARRRACGC